MVLYLYLKNINIYLSLCHHFLSLTWQDGIPMESERLIHVTPRPPKVHKVNKNHHKSSQATAAVTPSPFSHSSSPAAKPKAHKPPKKYSPKKHGWKKSLRKEKGKDKSKDKAKEKRERREKRNKALHRAVVARKLWINSRRFKHKQRRMKSLMHKQRNSSLSQQMRKWVKQMLD